MCGVGSVRTIQGRCVLKVPRIHPWDSPVHCGDEEEEHRKRHRGETEEENTHSCQAETEHEKNKENMRVRIVGILVRGLGFWGSGLRGPRSRVRGFVWVPTPGSA